ncbi:MAG TPA: UDP-N-acetylglucosamine 2-epimerase (non-hydrolyzing) [Acidobacteriota bacterium]|nr:UDP-N-acetylglucosamine 2-epimerase (non-hydrolyzing) [Acidobacteriota bacterium]
MAKNEKRAKLATVVGTRPQFIKAMPLSAALKDEGFEECLIHTGQHYDYEMSEVFFRTMKLREPDYNLDAGSASHGAQTGRMLEKMEAVLLKEKPAATIVYGDTNSTLAGALASAKLHIPVFHVEAGLRSFNRDMPEEINRVLTDHVSELLFAPSDKAVENLAAEGLSRNVFRTGDVMYDAFTLFREKYSTRASGLLKTLHLTGISYGVVTIHRQENTDNDRKWKNIIRGLKDLGKSGVRLVWLVHPRTGGKLRDDGFRNIDLIKPLSYFDMQALLSRAKIVITDSGGLQKEAYFHRIPCVTLRDETEWVELQAAGVNRVVGTDPGKIVGGALEALREKKSFAIPLFGNGKAARDIVGIVKKHVRER